MPGKHVRFASTKLLYSPHATIPSLSHSLPSPQSSTGPITPPQHPPALPYHSASYAPVHKAFPSRRPVAPMGLSTSLAVSHRPAIKYDVSVHPSSATAHHGHIHAILAGPATNPPVPLLTIISPQLPWPIPVHAPPRAFVSVSDVLIAIYHTLRKHITEHEYNSLLSYGARKRVKEAYEHRYLCAHDRRASAEEKKGGLRRVDFLMGRTRLLGLSPTMDGPLVWSLSVG